MNKRVHRLVFDRRRGMCVPAAEHTRSAGKAGSGQCGAPSSSAASASVIVALGASLALGSGSGLAATRSLGTMIPRTGAVQASKAASGRPMQNLPQRVRDYSTGNPDGNPADVGKFTIGNVNDATLQINQTDTKVIINWDSFDIGRGYTVRFVQPSSSASALNNIWDINPSVILGHIEANGEVLLQNQNGILFGPTARVDTQRFVATALKLADEAFMKGVRAGSGGSPMFGSDTQGDAGFISIERGAEITALAGGDVIMVAPKVYNEGLIQTPDGQTVLAAGKKVYLYGSTDASRRGLWVAVDAFDPSELTAAGGNTVEVAAKEVQADGTVLSAGQVSATTGSINLVGMVVRQNGKLSATTAVKGQNGGIYLQASKSTFAPDDITNREIDGLGSVEFGEGSITQVTPSDNGGKQKDAETFYRSRVEVLGNDIRVRSGAQLTAVSGNIDLLAASSAQSNTLSTFLGGNLETSGGASVVVDPGAKLSVAGWGSSLAEADLQKVTVAMSRNQGDLSLYQSELADSPVQRGGVVYRNEVYFDARKPVALANVKGFYNLINRDAYELSTRGGNIHIVADGSVVLADGAKLDISGGVLRYAAGQVFESVLGLGTGRTVTASQAKAGTRYAFMVNPGQQEGDTGSVGGINLSAFSSPVEASYLQGADAGSLTVTGGKRGEATYLGADIAAGVVVGPYQSQGAVVGNYVSAVSTADNISDLNKGTSAELGRAVKLINQPDLYASLRPLGGSLTFNTSAGDIHLSELAGLNVGSVPEVGSEDWASALASWSTQTWLSSQKLQASKLSQVSILGAALPESGPQNVLVDADFKLNLGASGSFSADSSQTGSVWMSGQIRAPGGSVSLAGGDGGVVVASTAMLDVSGGSSSYGVTGVTDPTSPTGLPYGEVASTAGGGTVTVRARGSVTLQEGALLDVSGVLLRTTTEGSVKGAAGTINLKVNEQASVVRPDATNTGELTLGATLKGYDFASGGTLNIDGVRTALIGTLTDDTDTRFERGLKLGADFFSAGGFGSFSLKAMGDILVSEGTQITPVLSNLVEQTLGNAAVQVGRPLGNDNVLGNVAVQVLAAGLRKPVSISLDASGAKPYLSGVEEPQGLDLGGTLTVGEGARIDAGLGGSVSLKAYRRVDLWGDVVAHGGTVSAGLSNSRKLGSDDIELDDIGYLPDQGVYLHAGSRIDVSGAAKVVVASANRKLPGQRAIGVGNLADRVTGSVLGGGVVNLNLGAPKGWVVAEAGSTIDVSGAAADLNLTNTAQTTRVSAGAGTVNVSSVYGFYLGGTMLAAQPDGSVGGGSFNATTSTAAVGILQVATSVDRLVSYPVSSAAEMGQVHLLATTADVVAAPLTFGTSAVSAQSLLEAGFDRIGLKASQRIVLGDGASLKGQPGVTAQSVPLRSVVLDAPVLQAQDSGDHTIQASYVALGSDAAPEGVAAASATAGDAALHIEAGLIEVYGNRALQGFKEATLDATLSAAHVLGERRDGEVRLIGSAKALLNSATIESLNTNGILNLTAGNVYATTLSNYVLNAGTDGLIKLRAPEGGSTSAAPLSALARLSLKAGTIDIDGSILQPFGQISLQAPTVTLGANSVLSVSGAGLSVPVGVTLNGQQWLYGTAGTASALTSTDTTVKVLDGSDLGKRIKVEGADGTAVTTLTVNAASRIEAQAGGDLLAWEFVQGVGGTTDTYNRANVYAIVPGYTYDFAPYDVQTAATSAAMGQKLGAGDQIRVTTANGVLAPGVYTLMPARYGVLPGAVLVSTTTLTTGQTLSKATVQDDGSVIVSGYKTSVGTQVNGGNSPNLALVLEPEATFRAKSSVAVNSINTYLADKAERYGETTPVQPSAGGRVSLAASRGFDWRASYKLLGGELDLSMGSGQLAVVNDDQATPKDSVRVSAEALSATLADSILLGGLRDGSGSATTIKATASSVLIEGNVTAGELITVAQNGVELATGASLAVRDGLADTASTQVFTITGQGAALAVSQNTALDLRRDLSTVSANATPSGKLTVAAGSTLKGGSVVADASQTVSVADQLTLEASNLVVGAQRIAVGEGAATAGALALTGKLLDQVNTAQSATLRSYSSLDMLGSATLGQTTTKKLVIDAREVRGQGKASDTAVIQAANVLLRNTTGTVADGSSTGDSTLTVKATPALSDVQTGGITVGEGKTRLAFAAATLQSQGDIVFDGQGADKNKLSSQGDLTLSAARVTATTSANHAVQSGGVLTVTNQPGSRTLGERVGLGGQLALSGQRVLQQGLVELNSGAVTLSGTGQAGQSDTVVLGEGSRTSAAGVIASAGQTWAVSSGGGTVTATASTGDVRVLGEVDVSAGVLAVPDATTGKVIGYQAASASDTAKAAGTITLQAVAEGAQVVFGANASLLGHAATDSLSGNLKVDAGQVTNASNVVASTRGTLDQLAKLANEGGMHGSVDVRVRAADVAQSLDTMMKAVRTRLSVDKSSLTLMGGAVMDAAAPQGGLVQLSAKGLSLDSGASIDATSSRTGAQGGDVLVSAVDGGLLSLNEGATVDAGLGRIVLRANRDDTAADDAPLTDILKIDPVKASLKATEVLVEANRVYEGYTSVKTGSSSGLALGQDDLADDTTTFMGRKDSLLTALGLADQANVHLRSGVEIRSTGDLTINGDWNLWQADRAGGEPIMLTLRAGGNLNVKGSISDGFETTTRASATATEASVMADGAAASLRLVAGADSAAADLLTTHAKEAGGDLVIDAKKMVRTTAGSIELAAANNIELKVQAVTFNTVGKASVVPEQAVVYVAGRPATLADGDTGLASSNVWARYTEGGGRLEAVAGNDIKAPGASQQFGNWLYHASAEDNADATSWWSVLDSFKQGLGSFGGGNIYVQAQGNIVNLGVVSPTSGRNVLSGTGEVALDVRNGGDVTIKAGGDIQGGAFLLGRGEGRIEAGGAIVAGSNLNTKVAGVGAILGLMDGHWLLQARGDVLLAGAYNPTALTSPATRVPDSDAYLFFTYSPDASLSLSSAAGDVTWKTGSLLDYYGTYLTKVIVSLSAPVESSPISGDATNALLQAAPPIVRLAAMQGNATIDITKAANLTLFPSDQGDLSIFAGQDVQLQSHGNGGLVMADGDASRWPSVSHPVQERASASTLIENLNLPELFPSAPVVTAELLTSSTLHADDTVPARVFAGEDIAFSAGDSANSLTQFNLAIPKQATLEATGDILNPQYTGEHFHDSDVTLIKAGGNVVGSTAATDNRSIGYIQLLGAGELQIEAGRRLDLRTSAGVQTLGNFNKDALGVAKNGNSALGDESASIRISASMNKALELDKFASLYLNNNPQAQAELVAYVKQTLKLGQGALPDDVQTAYPQALALFAGFSKAHQVSFAQGLLDRAFVARYVAPGQAYAQSWQDFAASKGANASDLQSAVFGEFKDEVVMAEVRRLGSQAVDLADSTDPGLNAQRQAQRDALWAQVDAMSSLAGLGQGFSFLGDVDLGGSKVHTLGTGNFTQGGIDFFVPGGGVLVGYNAALTAEKASNVARKRGVVTYDGGSIRSFTESDFQVNTQKAFVVGTGDVVVYSRSGDIDSGRGSNTDVTVPPPEAITDPDTGNIVFVSPAVTKGSGIGLLKNAQGGATGTIELYTPKGTVRALDTFITSESGGEIRVAGTILGADNLKGAVKGGAPAVAGPTLKVGTTLPGDTAAGIEAVTAASQSGQRKEANGILTVELLNLGDGSDGGTAPAAGTKKPCKPDDKDCNKP